MSAAEVDMLLSGFSDERAISPWARNYIAFAIKNNMVKGDTATTVSPHRPMDGKSYATVILRNLGYEIDAQGWSTALQTLSEKGGLTAGNVVKFDKPSLIKNDIVAITYSALKTIGASGASLAEILAAEGVISRNDAAGIGLNRGGRHRHLPSAFEEDYLYFIIKNSLLSVKSEVNLSPFHRAETVNGYLK
jgi:hypothetical protein